MWPEIFPLLLFFLAMPCQTGSFLRRTLARRPLISVDSSSCNTNSPPMCIFSKTLLLISADMASICLSIVLSEGGTLAISLAASGPSISFTMALQAGSISVSATVSLFGFGNELSDLVARFEPSRSPSWFSSIMLPVSVCGSHSCFDVTGVLFGDGVYVCLEPQQSLTTLPHTPSIMYSVPSVPQ